MCNFISWRKITKNGKTWIWYLDDKEVFSERTKELTRGSKDNDLLGHHAIDEVYSLDPNEGEQGELRDFWETSRLPKELQAKLEDFQSFEQNFGRMVETYAQRDDLEYIIRNAPDNKKWKGLKEFCRKPLLKILEPILRQTKQEVLKVTVRRDLAVKELVKANKFDGHVDSNVNDTNFSAKKGRQETKEAILLDFGASVSDVSASVIMDQLGLCSGSPKELLSLGIDHPDRQRHNPLVALGQSCFLAGRRRVLYLFGWGGERYLYLSYLGLDWDAGCRFLAFRKSSRR